MHNSTYNHSIASGDGSGKFASVYTEHCLQNVTVLWLCLAHLIALICLFSSITQCYYCISERLQSQCRPSLSLLTHDSWIAYTYVYSSLPIALWSPSLFHLWTVINQAPECDFWPDCVNSVLSCTFLSLACNVSFMESHCALWWLCLLHMPGNKCRSKHCLVLHLTYTHYEVHKDLIRCTVDHMLSSFLL